MAISLSTQDILTKGQLQSGQFPNCPDDQALDALVLGEITDAVADIAQRCPTAYASAESAIVNRLTRAATYLVLGRLWQQILSVMIGYDAEALPPEFVDPAAAERQRDWYMDEAERILATYDRDPTDNAPGPGAKPLAFVKPYFGTAGLEDDAVTTTGVIRDYADTGALPE